MAVCVWGGTGCKWAPSEFIDGRMKAPYLVWMLERPAVNAIVGGVEAAFREPHDVSGLKRAGSDGFKGFIPVQGLTCGLVRHMRISVSEDLRAALCTASF